MTRVVIPTILALFLIDADTQAALQAAPYGSSNCAVDETKRTSPQPQCAGNELNSPITNQKIVNSGPGHIEEKGQQMKSLLLTSICAYLGMQAPELPPANHQSWFQWLVSDLHRDIKMVPIVVDDDMACVESVAQQELKRFIHLEAAKNFTPAPDTSLGVGPKRVSGLDGNCLGDLNCDNEDQQLPSTAKPTIGPPSPDEDCSIWDGCQSPVPIPLPRPRPQPLP
jgi:hypothetical protein